MNKAPDTLAALRRTLSIVQDRGWAAVLSLDDTGPQNLRNTIANACTEIVGLGVSEGWYKLYLATVHTLGEHLQRGIADWEFDVKASSEVEAMLAEVIAREEARLVQ